MEMWIDLIWLIGLPVGGGVPGANGLTEDIPP